jgi:phosphomannomutase
MNAPEVDPTAQEAVAEVNEAVRAGRVSASAAENIQVWLTRPQYREYLPQLLALIREEEWNTLDDYFWKVIPFGTGGRRGKMYAVGCNAINDRTIGESAAGLAAYVKANVDNEAELSCAVAYDTRHNSRHFAELCSRIMVAAGFRVYFLDGYRSTPALSFLVRYKQCSCGIMVTASHNPPSDNAVKVYWSTGGQVLPPHDVGIIDVVMNGVEEIELGDTFANGLATGNIVECTAEADGAFLDAVAEQAFDGPRDVKVLYSPLHGVGHLAVVPALKQCGFEGVELFGPQAEPDGDFPHVPEHVSNPENAAVFDALIAEGRKSGFDLALATDPDCDRIGIAAPLTADASGPWRVFTGNQIAALLTDYVLEKRQAAGTLTPNHYVVKTLVTTELVRRIADSYGVRTEGNLHVGFKWIGGKMEERGAENFVFGCEESHGYLAGRHVRDKDGVVGSLLMASLAAQLKAVGQSVNEKLEALYWQHGYHGERLVTQQMEGSDGMRRMRDLMAAFRERPPRTIAGLPVVAVRDYLNSKTIVPGEEEQSLDAPQGDMVVFDLREMGNYVAARPSGTEPKVKFYMFTFVPAEQLHDLEETQREMDARLDAMQADLATFAEAV